MKLNKEVCRRCVNRHVESSEHGENPWRTEWCEWDDQRWDEGRVLCPILAGKPDPWLDNSITNLPAKCKYRSEQLVSQKSDTL